MRQILRSEDDPEELQDDIGSLLSLSDDCSEETENKIQFNYMNFALTNARSLPPKINSFVTAFNELDLDFMMVTETWIRNTKATARNINDLNLAENIQLVTKNCGSRGGSLRCIQLAEGHLEEIFSP